MTFVRIVKKVDIVIWSIPKKPTVQSGRPCAKLFYGSTLRKPCFLGYKHYIYTVGY